MWVRPRRSPVHPAERAHPRQGTTRCTVPLVTKPGEDNPTGYLTEIADLITDPNGRAALNLREDSIALLEALAACSAVLEIDRTGLQDDPWTPWHARRGAGHAPGSAQAHRRRRPTWCASRTPRRCRAGPRLQVRPAAGRRRRAAGRSPTRPIGEVVTGEFARQAGRHRRPCSARRPTRTTGWHISRSRCARSPTAPPDQLEWAFRGYLDLFSTRLDAWFTGLATERLSDAPVGAPDRRARRLLGLRRGPAPRRRARRRRASGSCTRPRWRTPPARRCCATAGWPTAVTTAPSSTSRSPPTGYARAMWLLEGVAQGQRLAALLGYRLERKPARVRSGDDALPDADASDRSAARAPTSRRTSPSRCSRPGTSSTG